nr:hypothetical protein [Tanacetum cinerariifolium]
MASNAADRAGEMKENVKGKANEMAGRAADRAGEMKEKAKETGHDMKRSAEETAATAADKAEEGRSKAADMAKTAKDKTMSAAEAVVDKTKETVAGAWDAAKGTGKKIKETVVGTSDDEDDWREDRVEKHKKIADEHVEDLRRKVGVDVNLYVEIMLYYILAFEGYHDFRSESEMENLGSRLLQDSSFTRNKDCRNQVMDKDSGEEKKREAMAAMMKQ